MTINLCLDKKEKVEEKMEKIWLMIFGIVLWELLRKIAVITSKVFREYKKRLRESGSWLCALNIHDYEKYSECGCEYKSCEREGCNKTVPLWPRSICR